MPCSVQMIQKNLQGPKYREQQELQKFELSIITKQCKRTRLAGGSVITYQDRIVGGNPQNLQRKETGKEPKVSKDRITAREDKGEEGGITGGEGLEDAGSPGLDVVEDVFHQVLFAGGQSTVHSAALIDDRVIVLTKELGDKGAGGTRERREKKNDEGERQTCINRRRSAWRRLCLATSSIDLPVR